MNAKRYSLFKRRHRPLRATLGAVLMPRHEPVCFRRFVERLNPLKAGRRAQQLRRKSGQTGMRGEPVLCRLRERIFTPACHSPTKSGKDAIQIGKVVGRRRPFEQSETPDCEFIR